MSSSSAGRCTAFIAIFRQWYMAGKWIVFGTYFIRYFKSCLIRRILLISMHVSISLMIRPLTTLRNEFSLHSRNSTSMKEIKCFVGTQMHTFFNVSSGIVFSTWRNPYVDACGRSCRRSTNPDVFLSIEKRRESNNIVYCGGLNNIIKISNYYEHFTFMNKQHTADDSVHNTLRMKLVQLMVVVLWVVCNSEGIREWIRRYIGWTHIHRVWLLWN